MRQAGADATRLNALRTCIRDFQCAAARGSESRSDRCWVAAENGATTFMGLLCPGRGRPPSEDNVPRIHFCGPEAGRLPQRRGQTGSTADHRTTQQRPIAMKCAASLGALGLVLVHWLPAVTAWPPPPADFWAAYRRFYPVDGGAPWTAQSSPTSVVFPTQRYAPDRMDPYRFGFTTDRYGRGFGYSCKDVFECQALKEKQELAAESYRGFSPQSFASPPPLAAYREPTMADRAPSGHQRGRAPPARFAPAPRLPPLPPYW
ncbi:hypothetical protein HPB51_019367 [Rhipicephalus microplus]|uniref:Uncharacterized protein n=1 Tax=Rhipicephalus microplus TaxID=6941 RepID=A0A9J6DBR8_RHIMP|nr:uncharacterized protein LOC119176971 [Rhipicephalus microplus]KAH8019394.1 hypothetical protein HPB51_019367 [Rhipicephalus microplus]